MFLSPVYLFVCLSVLNLLSVQVERYAYADVPRNFNLYFVTCP